MSAADKVKLDETLPNQITELSNNVYTKEEINNKFDNDTLYLRNCRYEKEASAVGIAMTFMDEYFRTII